MLPINLEMSKDFYKAEYKCEYFVSEKSKRIMAVQLDLLHEFDKVCKKNDITYSVYAGTLLGAVRHKGFIPWDDDIDVCMTRSEYEKLKRVAEKEFTHPYFFQTLITDRKYFCGYARLRNSLTTGVIAESRDIEYNNGIYIDVFVMDGYIKDQNESIYQKQIKMRERAVSLLQDYYGDITGKPKRCMHLFIKRVENLFIPYKWLVAVYEKIISLYNSKANKLTMMTHNVELLEKYWCPKECFNEVIYIPFENIAVPVFKQYDRVLTNLYGNYMEFPPVEKRGTWHNGILEFEPDVPYQEYLQMNVDK